MKIIIASKNPVKIAAAEAGFAKMLPQEEFAAEGVSVPSGVPDQPLSDAETLIGAQNRAEGAWKEKPDADFWIGIEGGVEDGKNGMAAFAWVYIIGANGTIGKARTSTLFLPEKIATLIRAGKELGEADDIVFGRTNSKHKDGAVGILTKGAITRTTYYTEAVVLALIGFTVRV